MSALSATFTLLQSTQLRLIRPQLGSSLLAIYFAPHGSPRLSPGFFSPHSFNTQWMESIEICSHTKTSASHFYWETPCSPSGLFTTTKQSLSHGELPFKGLFQAVFPTHCELEQNLFFNELGQGESVWSQGGGYISIFHFSFSWRFYPKRLTISAFNHEGTNPEQQKSRKYNFFKNKSTKCCK